MDRNYYFELRKRMASLPTPEETAREILAIFVEHFNCKPGEVLRSNSFMVVWHDRGLNAADFAPGMEFAVSKGWAEIPQGGLGQSYRITQAGFDEA